MRLIHLTDPHLTSLDACRPGFGAVKRWLSWLSWHARRRQRHRHHRLAALTRGLKAVGPDAWAITGDLCQIGLEREAREAARWLAELAPSDRTLVVPGNHDIFAPDSHSAISRHWSDYLHLEEQAPAWPAVRYFGDVALIGVNSAVVTPMFKASGRLGHGMRDRLGKTLAAHREFCRIVLIHHPPLPGVCKRRKALADDQELGELLAEHGAAMVLHGHLHRNREYEIEAGTGAPVPVFCTGSASAAGKQGAASARVFDIESMSGGYRIRMRLGLLDASDKPHTVETRQWDSAG